jgi:hypothetical protein
MAGGSMRRRLFRKLLAVEVFVDFFCMAVLHQIKSN